MTAIKLKLQKSILDFKEILNVLGIDALNKFQSFGEAFA